MTGRPSSSSCATSAIQSRSLFRRRLLARLLAQVLEEHPDLRDKRDVVLKIDVEKEGQLLLRKAFLWREKAPPERVRARSSDCREHPGPVIGTKGADFNRSTVAKVLDDRIVSGQRHEKWFPVRQRGALPAFGPS